MKRSVKAMKTPSHLPDDNGTTSPPAAAPASLQTEQALARAAVVSMLQKMAGQICDSEDRGRSMPLMLPLLLLRLLNYSPAAIQGPEVASILRRKLAAHVTFRASPWEKVLLFKYLSAMLDWPSGDALGWSPTELLAHVFGSNLCTASGKEALTALSASQNPFPDTAGKLVPFSQSVRWRNQRVFYKDAGGAAWTKGTVPFAVSSSANIACSYAHAVFAIAQDALAAGTLLPDASLYVLELCAGHCQLGFLVQRRLAALLAAAAEPELRRLRACVVITDFHAGVLARQAAAPCFAGPLRRGEVRFAVVDASTSVQPAPSSPGGGLEPSIVAEEEDKVRRAAAFDGLCSCGAAAAAVTRSGGSSAGHENGGAVSRESGVEGGDVSQFCLIHGGSGLLPGSIVNPLVIMANYALDSLPADVFVVDAEGRRWELMEKVREPKDMRTNSNEEKKAKVPGYVLQRRPEIALERHGSYGADGNSSSSKSSNDESSPGWRAAGLVRETVLAVARRCMNRDGAGVHVVPTGFLGALTRLRTLLAPGAAAALLLGDRAFCYDDQRCGADVEVLLAEAAARKRQAAAAGVPPPDASPDMPADAPPSMAGEELAVPLPPPPSSAAVAAAAAAEELDLRGESLIPEISPTRKCIAVPVDFGAVQWCVEAAFGGGPLSLSCTSPEALCSFTVACMVTVPVPMLQVLDPAEGIAEASKGASSGFALPTAVNSAPSLAASGRAITPALPAAPVPPAASTSPPAAATVTAVPPAGAGKSAMPPPREKHSRTRKAFRAWCCGASASDVDSICGWLIEDRQRLDRLTTAELLAVLRLSRHDYGVFAALRWAVRRSLLLTSSEEVGGSTGGVGSAGAGVGADGGVDASAAAGDGREEGRAAAVAAALQCFESRYCLTLGRWRRTRYETAEWLFSVGAFREAAVLICGAPQCVPGEAVYDDSVAASDGVIDGGEVGVVGGASGCNGTKAAVGGNGSTRLAAAEHHLTGRALFALGDFKGAAQAFDVCLGEKGRRGKARKWAEECRRRGPSRSGGILAEGCDVIPNVRLVNLLAV